MKAEKAKTAAVPPPPMSEASMERAKVPENPFDFQSANSKKKKSKLRGDLEKIVETNFVVDLHESWLKLRAALVIGEKRSEHGTLNKALDEAEENAHLAHRVYVTAKIEREAWERENDTVWGAMWSEANKSLQKEKNEGLRAKQLTDADIKARVATLYPEEYQEIEVRRARIKATVDSLEDLAVQWKSRCKSLNTMKGTLRG
jgi:hypothetical protein